MPLSVASQLRLPQSPGLVSPQLLAPLVPHDNPKPCQALATCFSLTAALRIWEFDERKNTPDDASTQSGVFVYEANNLQIP